LLSYSVFHHVSLRMSVRFYRSYNMKKTHTRSVSKPMKINVISQLTRRGCNTIY
jgi:hypothetical protein